MGSQKESREYVDFITPHSPKFEMIGPFYNPMPQEKSQANLLHAAEPFQNWPVCLTTWERSMSQMQPHASKNGGISLQTAEIHRLQICQGKQLVHPAALTTLLTKFPLYNGFAEVRWLPHYAAACEIALVRKMWDGCKLISWIARKTHSESVRRKMHSTYQCMMSR